MTDVDGAIICVCGHPANCHHRGFGDYGLSFCAKHCGCQWFAPQKQEEKPRSEVYLSARQGTVSMYPLGCGPYRDLPAREPAAPSVSAQKANELATAAAVSLALHRLRSQISIESGLMSCALGAVSIAFKMGWMDSANTAIVAALFCVAGLRYAVTNLRYKYKTDIAKADKP